MMSVLRKRVLRVTAEEEALIQLLRDAGVDPRQAAAGVSGAEEMEEVFDRLSTSAGEQQLQPKLNRFVIKLVGSGWMEDPLRGERVNFAAKFRNNTFESILVYVIGRQRLVDLVEAEGSWETSGRWPELEGYPLNLPIRPVIQSRIGLTVEEIQEVLPDFRANSYSFKNITRDQFNALSFALRRKDRSQPMDDAELAWWMVFGGKSPGAVTDFMGWKAGDEGCTVSIEEVARKVILQRGDHDPAVIEPKVTLVADYYRRFLAEPR